MCFVSWFSSDQSALSPSCSPCWAPGRPCHSSGLRGLLLHLVWVMSHSEAETIILIRDSHMSGVLPGTSRSFQTFPWESETSWDLSPATSSCPLGLCCPTCPPRPGTSTSCPTSGPRMDSAEIFHFPRQQSLPRGFGCVWHHRTLIYFLMRILTS